MATGPTSGDGHRSLDLTPANRMASDGPSRKASQLIAADLRRRIVRGEVLPGHALPAEADLVAAFQVSRETLREALSVLESETLIRIKRGRGGGAVVCRPDRQAAARHVGLLLQVRGGTARDVVEARQTMVGPVAAMIAEHPPLTALDQLGALHRVELAADGPVELAIATAAFDQAVVDLAGNVTLSTLAGVLCDAHAAVLVAQGHDGLAELARVVVEGHGEFVAALAGADASRAAKAWTAYHDASLNALEPGARVDVVPLWEAAAAGSSVRRAATVTEQLRARIARGALADGDHLPPVPDLAAEFDVSRPTLREALRVLETEGLIELRPGSRVGARVLPPSTEMAATLVGILLESGRATMSDVWEARTLLEPAVMALAADRITEQELAPLRQHCADAPWMSTDTATFAQAGMVFRFQALGASHNEALGITFEMIRSVAAASLAAVTSSAGNTPWEIRRNRVAAAAYSELTEALAGGDGRRAARVWERHLRSSVPYYEAQLGDRFIVDLVHY